MRNMVISLVFLLIAITAFGQDYPISGRRDSLRYAALGQLNINESGTRRLTATSVNVLINRAQGTVCDDAPAYMKFDTAIIDNSMEAAALNDDFLRLHAVFRMVDTLRVAMTVVPADSIPRLTSTFEENIHKKNDPMSPAYCYTWGRNLKFHPKYIASTADSFLVEYFAMAPELVDDTQHTVIESKWLEPMILYACALIEVKRERTQSAALLFSMYESAVGRMPKPRIMEGEK